MVGRRGARLSEQDVPLAPPPPGPRRRLVYRTGDGGVGSQARESTGGGARDGMGGRRAARRRANGRTAILPARRQGGTGDGRAVSRDARSRRRDAARRQGVHSSP